MKKNLFQSQERRGTVSRYSIRNKYTLTLLYDTRISLHLQNYCQLIFGAILLVGTTTVCVLRTHE